MDPLDPPQAHKTIASSGTKRQRGVGLGSTAVIIQINKQPNTATTQSHQPGLSSKNHPCDRAAVVTVTVKVDTVVAFSCTAAGTEQETPVGAPVQDSDALPVEPCPPIAREYIAPAPAATVAEADPPGAKTRPSEAAPVPASATVCGLFGAFEVIVRVPVRDPFAVGVKVTEIWQLVSAAIEAPQLFDSAKSPLVWIPKVVIAVTPAVTVTS